MSTQNLNYNLNYGLKLAKAGYDVFTAPDYGLLFNSSWPSLQIAFEKYLTVSEANQNGYVYHNLNFPPLTMIWYTQNNTSYGRLNGLLYSVDNSKVNFSLPSYFDNSGTIAIRCFNTDISNDIYYPLPQSLASQGPYNPNYGIKIAKQNKDLNSTNLNDFILHTKGQSPAILDIATSAGKYGLPVSQGSLINYNVTTSYLPWFSGALKNFDGTYQYLNITDVQYAADSKTLILNSSLLAGVLIILRDPLFYPSSTKVSYNG